MATDYGTDIAARDDIADDFRLVSGVDLLIQDAYHRVTHEDLIDERGWGIDVTERVGDAGDDADIAAIALAMSEAIGRDARVDTVTVTGSGTIGATPEQTVARFLVDATAVGGESFQFVVSVENLTAELLRGGE